MRSSVHVYWGSKPTQGMGNKEMRSYEEAVVKLLQLKPFVIRLLLGGGGTHCIIFVGY